MKKSRQFSNSYPDDGEEFGYYWNRDALAEDLTDHTHQAGRSESKAKRAARRNRRQSARDGQTDDVIAD